jgi:hypothetical protein
MKPDRAPCCPHPAPLGRRPAAGRVVALQISGYNLARPTAPMVIWHTPALWPAATTALDGVGGRWREPAYSPRSSQCT